METLQCHNSCLMVGVGVWQKKINVALSVAVLKYMIGLKMSGVCKERQNLFYRFPYLNTVRWYSNSIETVDWLSLSELFDWLTLTSDRPSSHFYYSFQNRNNFDSVSDGHCLLLKIQLFWLNRYEKWQQPLSCRRFWAVSRNPSNFVLVRVSVT